jgi:hypothetical protein
MHQRAWVLLGIVFLPLTCFCLDKKVSFSITPKKVSQGQVAFIRLNTHGLPTREARAVFGEQNFPLWNCLDDKDAWCGLLAVPLDTPLGEKPVSLTATVGSQLFSETVPLKVAKGKFKINLLKVAPQLTRPSEEEQKQIEQDKKDLEAAYAAPTLESVWSEPFSLPTSGGVTSLFGNQRRYNGQVSSTHYGVDLRAGEKTPIHAINKGKVLLARQFFYAGNMVLLDHGMGVYSSYSHLSRLDVKPGQEVKRGDLLGMAGATGRVTGPHLHWGTRLNGHPVDPHRLVAVANLVFHSSKKSQ